MRRQKNLDLTMHVMDKGLFECTTKSGAISLLNVPTIQKSINILKNLD